MNRSKKGLFCAGCLFLLSIPLLAHHSNAPYDGARETTLEGVVKRFEWNNPHAWLYMDVTGENAQVNEWSIELGAPGTLKRRGWSRNTFKPGDKVKIMGNPARNGSNQLRMLKGYDANGAEVVSVVRQ